MKKLNFLTAFIVITSAALILNSCSKNDSPSTPPATLTLYDTLGGTTLVADAITGTMQQQGYLTIRNIIDSTIFIIAADTRINGHFISLLGEIADGNFIGFVNLSDKLSTFVAVATGAQDYTYTGLSMANAHNPATNSRMNGKATSSDFDAFEDDLTQGAAKNGVQSTDPAFIHLAAIVESLRSVIVQQ